MRKVYGAGSSSSRKSKDNFTKGDKKSSTSSKTAKKSNTQEGPSSRNKYYPPDFSYLQNELTETERNFLEGVLNTGMSKQLVAKLNISADEAGKWMKKFRDDGEKYFVKWISK